MEKEKSNRWTQAWAPSQEVSGEAESCHGWPRVLGGLTLDVARVIGRSCSTCST